MYAIRSYYGAGVPFTTGILIGIGENRGEIGLKIKLEEMILDETGHAEQIQRILKGM